MDADWDELRVVPHLGPLPAAVPVPVNVFAFDNSQELLWVGSQYGRVRSLYGAELQTYSSYVAHPNNDVRQILSHEKGIITLSGNHLHMCNRGGPQIWHISDSNFSDLRCMSFTSKDASELLVAGTQSLMFKVDIERGMITEILPAQDQYTLMKFTGQYICAANYTGAIHIIDPTSLNVVKIWQAHRGMISDMDAKSDFLVTCGLSPRQQHGYMHDPLANVFDLKTLQPLPPIPFQPGAAFVRMHPKMSTTSIVVSQAGQIQVVDLMNPNTVNLKQAHIYENNYVTGLDMAPSGEALVLSSSMCQVHLWGSPSRLKFADFPNPTPMPIDISAALPTGLDLWDPNTPLNLIGMPYYRENLLSQWQSLVFEAGRMQPKIDQDLQPLMKRGEIGLYGPNLKHLRTNNIVYTRIELEANKNLVTPKFLSEKAREYSPEEDRGFGETISAMQNVQLDNTVKRDVPHTIYQNVEIKYSRFGVDDFDFEFYNKTPYSGLETHIANSYANPLLQLYRFIPIIRNLALLHTATSCLLPDCMLCQLGFLTDMLEKAEGQNCQATNFLKTFSGLSAAAQLNLLDEHPNAARTALANTIQAVNRFLLERFLTDFRLVAPQTPYLEQTLTTKVTTTIRCAHCSHEQMRQDSPSSLDLNYPAKVHHPSTRRPAASRVTFSQILKNSVEKQEQMRGYCPSCNRYQMLQSTRKIQNMPAVLMVNTANIVEGQGLWKSPNWLPSEVGIIVDNGQVYCYQDQDLRLHLQRNVYSIHVYELVGVVCEITSVEGQKPHLVSMVNVAPSSRDANAVDDWHIFNDFLVQPIPKEEALRFDNWKTPSVLAFQLKSMSHKIDDRWKDQLDTSILHNQLPSNVPPSADLVLLAEAESPKPGTLVGIDSEFVALHKEEIEIKADGSRETVRPSRLGLARVSVLRGDDGAQQDVPFIDDYILTTEQIVDYLTAYSGIREGDLDPSVSTHPLVTLKMAYKKIWLLLNLGCTFVGHGLLKDFRTINIHVPRGQVIDTVDLWYIRARARKLNLRFLAWLLLNEDVQGGESHDSVEDARTALRLWRKYQEVKRQGNMEETLEWVYKRGREVGYRAPGSQPPLPSQHNSRGPGSNGNNRLSGTDTTGRNTPDPTISSGVIAAASGMMERYSGAPIGSGRAGAGTPVKKMGFGAERVGFGGSPLR